MMQRTTVMLPSVLRIKINQQVQNLGMSMGEFMRAALEEKLEQSKQSRSSINPFFADHHFFTGETMHDLAKNHDQYLYGDEA